MGPEVVPISGYGWSCAVIVFEIGEGVAHGDQVAVT